MPDFDLQYLRRGNSSTKVAPVLEVESLSVAIGARSLFDGLNLLLNEGDVLRVSGWNGSGKSSLLNVIAGVGPAEATAGRIRVDGIEFNNMPAHLRARLGISYLRQKQNVFPSLTVEENLTVALGPDGPARFASSYPTLSPHLPGGKRAAVLSGGQRQMLGWAMATLRQFRLLLADEAEAGVNLPLPMPQIGTILLVSHSPQSAAFHENKP